MPERNLQASLLAIVVVALIASGALVGIIIGRGMPKVVKAEPAPIATP